MIFEVVGLGSANVNPVIRFSEATGFFRGFSDPVQDIVNQTIITYQGAGEAFRNGIRVGEFSSVFPNDPAVLAGVARDVTNQTLSFGDVELELFNQGPNPITVSTLSFLAIANTVQAVPEPSSLLLFAIGIAGLTGRRLSRQAWDRHLRT